MLCIGSRSGESRTIYGSPAFSDWRGMPYIQGTFLMVILSIQQVVTIQIGRNDASCFTDKLPTI
jgi:hypothetical protein